MVYDTDTAPYKIYSCQVFSVPFSAVRVLNPPYVGGGFGVRIGLSAKAEPIAILLSKLAGKPVKVVYTRKEDFIASDTRHGGYVYVKLGAKKDGTFQAMDLRATLNTGAYCSWGAEAPGVLGAMGLAVYRVPTILLRAQRIYQTTPARAMRGFGNLRPCCY